jgi:5'-deoxynucleotidase YfbR-like HD superfamily hydrolase
VTTTDALIHLGRLSLQFGRVDRITFHDDGATPESDTDHTVMLGLVACALAAEHGLDVGLVAQYALVHDLVEVYAGDTNTLGGLTPEAKADKKAREHAALLRIKDEFGADLWWLPETLINYENQVTLEARFVRAVDKLLPKVTHILNGAVTLRQQGVDPQRQAARYVEQRAEIAAYTPEWPWLLDLHADLVERVMERFAPAEVTA